MNPKTAPTYKRNFLIVVVLVACLIVSYYIGTLNAPQAELLRIVHTDTIYVKEVKPIVIEKATPPKKLRIQKAKDTARRKAVEKKTVNIGSKLDLTGGRVKYDVQTITPVGVVAEASHEYSLPEVKTIAINDTGAVEVVLKSNKELRREKRKRRLKRILNGVVVVAVFIMGVVI
jgi:hypothetical protein